MLLVCIFSGADWKVLRQMRCHKKLHLIESAVLCIRGRAWKFFLVTVKGVRRSPRVGTTVCFCPEFCQGNKLLCSHPSSSICSYEGAATLNMNFIFSKSQADCLPRRVSRPWPWPCHPAEQWPFFITHQHGWALV